MRIPYNPTCPQAKYSATPSNTCTPLGDGNIAKLTGEDTSSCAKTVAPLNSNSLLQYNSTTGLIGWADGSTQAPLNLPNIQTDHASSIVGVTTNGNIVLSDSFSTNANDVNINVPASSGDLKINVNNPSGAPTNIGTITNSSISFPTITSINFALLASANLPVISSISLPGLTTLTIPKLPSNPTQYLLGVDGNGVVSKSSIIDTTNSNINFNLSTATSNFSVDGVSAPNLLNISNSTFSANTYTSGLNICNSIVSNTSSFATNVIGTSGQSVNSIYSTPTSFSVNGLNASNAVIPYFNCNANGFYIKQNTTDFNNGALTNISNLSVVNVGSSSHFGALSNDGNNHKLIISNFGQNQGYGIKFNAVADVSPNTAGACHFFSSANVQVGYITTTTTGTLFSTTGDSTFVKSKVPISNALDRISSLVPYQVNWTLNEDEQAHDAFIADELQPIVPIAVSGKLNDINEDGSITPMGIDYGRLTPLLTACIHELVLKIEAQNIIINTNKSEIQQLMSRVTALEQKITK